MKDINNTTPVGDMSPEPTAAEVSLWVAMRVCAEQMGDDTRALSITGELVKRGVRLNGSRFLMPGQVPGTTATGVFDISLIATDAGSAS